MSNNVVYASNFRRQVRKNSLTFMVFADLERNVR